MHFTRLKAILPAIKIWLLVALASLGCVVFGQDDGGWNVWWLFTIGCWFVLDVYWAVAASDLNMAPSSQRNRTLLLMTLLIYSLYCLPLASVPIIGQRILPAYEPLQMLGAAMTAFGVGFAIWSRRVLADNWHTHVNRGKGNSLVQHGPYSIVRHPIYFGFLTAVIGMILVLGELRAVALLFAIELLLKKMTYEENILRAAFPAQYPAYEQKVSRLVPWIW
jgi:protein-S-isoprenylcysteine O-methyltransferase Ste14